MSKYDEADYMCKVEKERNNFSKSILESNPSENILLDFQKEFGGCTVEEIKKMMHLTEEEEKHFDFFVNGQEIVTKNFFNKANSFNLELPHDQRTTIIADYIKKTYGVLSPSVFKKVLVEVFQLPEKDLQGLQDKDAQELMMELFDKYQIDLDNTKDHAIFKEMLSSEEIKVNPDRLDKNTSKFQVTNSLFPSAVKDEIHIEDSIKKEDSRRLREEPILAS